MQKFKAEVEYCGTSYSGMQKQIGILTVQGAIETALEKFTGGQVKSIDFCGRTDAGVHAFAQVVHFEVQNRTEEQILKGLNYFLQIAKEKIAIKAIQKVDDNFHSRFSCIGREYKYFIYNNPVKSPVFEGKMHHVSQKLNVAKMQQAVDFILTQNDFSSFRGNACQALSPIKTIDFIEIKQISEEIIEIHIGAKSFLYKMVRNITGLLILIGTEKTAIEEITQIFDAKTIDALPYTSPPHGLYFWKAKY